jgi:hypothetical protein
MFWKTFPTIFDHAAREYHFFPGRLFYSLGAKYFFTDELEHIYASLLHRHLISYRAKNANRYWRRCLHMQLPENISKVRQSFEPLEKSTSSYLVIIAIYTFTETAHATLHSINDGSEYEIGNTRDGDMIVMIMIMMMMMSHMRIM